MGVRKLLVSLVMLGIVAAPALATIFATVKGVVHDPQHRPVPGAVVTLKARQADWTQTTTTDNEGTFQIAAVPAGEYTVTVVLQGFNTAQQAVTVVSDTAPVLHVQLELAGVRETVTVSASAEGVRPDSVTTTTLLSRQDIQNTPGADRTNGLEAITAHVPGSYVTHDQLHIRGGHQVSWLIDGVPVPNTNTRATSDHSLIRRTSTIWRFIAGATRPNTATARSASSTSSRGPGLNATTRGNWL